MDIRTKKRGQRKHQTTFIVQFIASERDQDRCFRDRKVKKKNLTQLIFHTENETPKFIANIDFILVVGSTQR